MTNYLLIFLRGIAIYLFLWEKRHASFLATGMNDHEVTRFLSRGDEPMTIEAQEEWIENLYKRPNDLTLGIWHHADQKPIGSAGLHQINLRDRYAIFGISIFDKQYWGQGVGTDVLTTLLQFAFETKNLRMVMLEVLANNPRAIRCYEKCGFRIVGNIPKKIFKNGQYVDSHWMVCERD